LKLQIIHLDLPNNLEIGLKHFNNNITINHSFDLSGLKYNITPIISNKIEFNDYSILEFQ